MGSRLSTVDKGDAAGPLQNVEFFKTVRAKWMEYFVCKLNENILSDLDISKTNEMLRWRDYFNIFAEIRGFVERDNDIKQRLHWHPATQGYMLQKELPRTPQKPASPPKNQVDDDYTEDEATDVSETDEEDKSNDNEDDSHNDNVSNGELENDDVKLGVMPHGDKESQASQIDSKDDGDAVENDNSFGISRPSHWNPEFFSPIFFGYSDLTVKVYTENIKEAKEEIRLSEERAVEKALVKRVEGLAEYEKSIRAKEIKRQERIDNITSSYLEERNRREETMNKEKLIMPEVGFRMYKV